MNLLWILFLTQVAKGLKFKVPVYPSEGEFMVDLKIGTPPVTLPFIVDTGSPVMGTRCDKCYNLDKSSSYTDVFHSYCYGSVCPAMPNSECSADDTCFFQNAYDISRRFDNLYFGIETFIFDNSSVPDIGFNCGTLKKSGLSDNIGVIGLAGGPLSLVEQLHESTFSHCFTSSSDDSGFLWVGSMPGTSKNKTQLLNDPHTAPYNYYVNVQGITIGDTLLSIPNNTFAINDDGVTGGFIIDSGTTITELHSSAFDAFKAEFAKQIKLEPVVANETGLELCFQQDPLSKADVPHIVFHFDGADLNPRVENYFISASGGLECLAVTRSTSEISILGNILQQNTLIGFDVKGQTVSFESVQSCNV